MREFEHELLIQLAPIYLACRWKVMGHQLRGWHCKSDLEFDLIGMMDYACEMRLLCEDWRQR